jgi:hypothetical protein
MFAAYSLWTSWRRRPQSHPCPNTGPIFRSRSDLHIIGTFFTDFSGATKTTVAVGDAQLARTHTAVPDERASAWTGMITFFRSGERSSRCTAKQSARLTSLGRCPSCKRPDSPRSRHRGDLGRACAALHIEA